MKKFIASYSGGKDSVLSIHKAIKQGLEPVALIITYNTDKERSWFHGIPEHMLENISESLNIPIWLIRTSGEEYAANFERTLLSAKELGAEICVFGDIDISGHIEWCRERCNNTGLAPLFPLNGLGRREAVFEFINAGYKACFTIIDTNRVSGESLGHTLTKETVEKIAAQGADICGENGEYHTFVYDGPIFDKPIKFKFGDKILENGYAILPVMVK